MNASIMPGAMQPFKVFYISAPPDQAIREELDKHLSPLINSSLSPIKTWHLDSATPGDDNQKEINQKLDEANVILILTSPDYSTDPQCQEYTRRTLARRKQDGVIVIPIYVRPTELDPELEDIRGFPGDRRPIKGQRATKRDEIYRQIEQHIRKLAQNQTRSTITEKTTVGSSPSLPAINQTLSPPIMQMDRTTLPTTSTHSKKRLPLWQRAFIIGIIVILAAGSLVGSAYIGYRVGYSAPHPLPPTIKAYIVTNMNSNGPGSFFDVVEHAQDGEDIVFKPGLIGTVYLTQNLEIKADAITINGNNTIILSNNDKGYRIHINPSKHIFMENLTFSDNSSDQTNDNYHNGFIFNEGGELMLYHCIIEKNMAAYNGGAIYNKLGTVNIEDCHFIDNHGDNNGGAIYNLRGQVNISYSFFQGNYAYSGGAIYNLAGTVIITSSCQITNNNALQTDGGGIASRNGTLAVSDSSLTDNTAKGDGGGIIIYGGWAQFSSVLLQDNTANQHGGGLSIELDTDNSQAGTVYFTTGYAGISNNTATNSQDHKDNNIWGQQVMNSHKAEFVSNHTQSTQYIPELTQQFLGNADISEYCRNNSYIGISSQSTAWNLQCRAPNGNSVAISNQSYFPKINPKDPIQTICAQQYNKLPTDVIDRLANNDDPASWQCYRDEKLEGNITTDLYPSTEMTRLAWYCIQKYGPGTQLKGLGATAYDWKCQEVSGTQQGLNMAEACVTSYGKSDAIDRFSDYNNRNSWQCWIPATSSPGSASPSTTTNTISTP